MKKLWILLLLVCTVGAFAAEPSVDDLRRTLYGAVEQAVPSLKKAPFGKKTISFLPIRGDRDDIIEGRLKNTLTNLGFNCVEGKSDPMWDEIMNEVAWDERKDDILDPATVVKFGKLKATQILMYGKVLFLETSNNLIYAEIELHATDLATKQHIWGGNFAFRHYLSEDAQGIVALDNDLKSLLKKNFSTAKDSLLEPQCAAKLQKVKTLAVVPLAGDIDRYMTGLAIESLTETSHLPKEAQIPSVSQTRANLRDGIDSADGIFYGMVRDLHKSKPVEIKDAQSRTVTVETVIYADVQLFLEEAKTGNILWSKTITLAEKLSSTRAMTKQELNDVTQEKIDDIPQNVKEDLLDNWKKYALIFALVIGGIVVLVIAVGIVKAIVCSRSIR